MVSLSINVTIIEDVLNFFMGEVVMQYGVKSSLIKNISNEEIMRGLFVNVLMTITREMRKEPLHVKIGKDVSIQRIFCGDGEEVLIEKTIV